jgi:hypothetical protein
LGSKSTKKSLTHRSRLHRHLLRRLLREKNLLRRPRRPFRPPLLPRPHPLPRHPFRGKTRWRTVVEGQERRVRGFQVRYGSMLMKKPGDANIVITTGQERRRRPRTSRSKCDKYLAVLRREQGLQGESPFVYDNGRAEELVIRMMVRNALSMRLVEDKDFRVFTHYLRPEFKVDRKRLSRVLLPNLNDKVKKEMQERLKNIWHYPCTFDSWTSVTNKSYLAVTLSREDGFSNRT